MTYTANKNRLKSVALDLTIEEEIFLFSVTLKFKE
jgi:hypothetical protein